MTNPTGNQKELIKMENKAYPRGQPEKSRERRNPELNNSPEYLRVFSASIFDCYTKRTQGETTI